MKKVSHVMTMLAAAFFLCALNSSCGIFSGAEQKKTAADASNEKLSEGVMLYGNALNMKKGEAQTKAFADAYKKLKVEAEKDKNVYSMICLGLMNEYGGWTKRNGIAAARWYRLAADTGKTGGKMALAEFWARNEMFHDDAIALIKETPDWDKEPKALLLLGKIEYSRHAVKKGFEFLKKAFALSQGFQMRRDIVALIHSKFEERFKNGNFEMAAAELQKETELMPKNAIPLFWRGVLEVRRGKPEAAEGFFRDALKLDPSKPEIYSELAVLLANAGKKTEALEYIITAVNLSGNAPLMQNARIDIHRRLNDKAGALEYVNRLARENPGAELPLIYRSEVNMWLKNYAEAYSDLKKITLDKKNKGGLFVISQFAAAASAYGKYAEAAEAYGKALAGSFNRISAINLAELYIVLDKYDKALELLGGRKFADSIKDAPDAEDMRRIKVYLEAAALLASGKDASAKLKEFNILFAGHVDKDFDWDTTMFEDWLSRAKLPKDALDKIRSLTNEVKKTFPREDQKKQ